MTFFALNAPEIVFKGDSRPASINNIDQHPSKYICTKFHAFYGSAQCGQIPELAAPLFEGV